MGVHYWLPLVLLLFGSTQAAYSTETSNATNASLLREFDRASVEAPPDVIRDGPAKVATSYAGEQQDSDGGVSTHFSRGSVEKAEQAETTPLQYFGAAQHYSDEPNQAQAQPAPGYFEWANPAFYEASSSPKVRSKDYFPARESVEGQPNQANIDQLRSKSESTSTTQ